MTVRGSASLTAVAVALTLSQASCKESSAPEGELPPAEPSLSVLEGTCAVAAFEVWSTNYSVSPAVRMLYDAAASGYVATLRIAASSRTSGYYDLTATSRDPLRVGDVASGTVTLVAPDSVRFSGAASLPGTTQFALTSTGYALANPAPRTVTLPPGPYQVTTRIVCRW